MSYSETITRTDLINILNEVLPVGVVPKSTTFTATSDANGYFQIPSSLNNTIVVWAEPPSYNTTVRPCIIRNGLTDPTTRGVRFKSWDDTVVLKSTSSTIKVWYLEDSESLTGVDYIVEQGTSGIWTYRKWNSGIAECWGTSTFTSVPMTNAWGYGYYASSVGRTINLPSGLFTAVNAVEVGVDFYGGTGNWNLDGRNTSQLNGYLWSTKSETRSKVDVFTTVKGKWK